MEERIKYLFRKYLNNTCSKEEFDELFAHMQIEDNDSFIREVLREETYHNKTNQASAAYVDEFGNLSGLINNKTNAAHLFTNKKRRKRMLVQACTAVLIIAASLFGMTYQHKDTSVSNHVPAAVSHIKKTTERSEYKYLLLPDSTQVWLNAASSLDFPENFNPAKREVTLQGEAYFDVKHADKIPFIIYTGKVSTVVMGTAFNIKAYPDLERITVSVQRGKVQVRYSNKQIAMLTRGEEVSIGNTTRIIKEKKFKEDEPIAWHEGNLVYDDYTIGDILADLERVYNVTIRVESPQLKTLRVSTSFKRTQGVDKALQILCRLTDTELKQENGTYAIK
ncbi:FecR domain-containing protein [Danxiaibacter flavus]|uniref:FecR domain-containing protein n=1 Tax=Danxiaibacter flavus TaxID=3049108 RepID=A0ABV3ZF75_9BACT|nr:FecR domain-containing protein [Chitinophagaceae bacterium DXS]